MKKDHLSKTENFQEPEGQRTSQKKAADIAIIGMACRFPGAKNYAEFWENLKQGRSNIQEIPQDRWDKDLYYSPDPGVPNTSVSKWGGFIEGVDQFDAGFFGISRREAECMDPQQRIMLELAWSCFEDAGIPPTHLSGKPIGVFIGVAILDYKELQEQNGRAIDAYYATGIHSSVIPNRISYYLNLKGPSVPFDTACSSSLYAIHAAAQSLQHGECSMALAGGVSVLLSLPRYTSFSKMGILSPTGSCKTFDQNADGIVRGEGAGLILLKPLSQAFEDGDVIYGILKGSAVNHSGRTNTLTYPNPDAQADVILAAYTQAGMASERISYIEVHGTGTPKGDPLEFEGLLKAFQREVSQKGRTLHYYYCGLGCVKPNIGHLEAAAGIAGVIKVLLALCHKQLPGLPNFKELNHRIALHNSPFYIVEHLQDWNPVNENTHQIRPRVAGVSGFGFSGTNAHLVIEEAPIDCDVLSVSKGRLEEAVQIDTHHSPELQCHLIALSAKTEDALRQKEVDFSSWLEQKREEHSLAEISATLLLGREHFEQRVAFVVKDIRELQERLQEVLETGDTEHYFSASQADKGKKLRSFFKEFGQKIIQELGSGQQGSEKESCEKFMLLADLYARGYDFNWKFIYGKSKPRHVNLPTYPFARARYWVPESKATSVDNGIAALSKPPASSSIETISSDISGKPSEILLQPLSEELIMPEQPTDQSRQHIRLDTIVTPAHTVILTKTLQQELTTSLSEISYMQPDEIDPDKQFIDLGLDSILGVEWMGALNQQYGISIAATKLYDHPNIREFAEFLSQELNQQGKHTVQNQRRAKDRPVFTPSSERENKATEHPLTLVQEQDERIAIIGMSGRYPEAQNLYQYWENLTQGTHSIQEIPPSRWDVNQYYDSRPGQTGKIYCKWLGALDDIECFDPLFFNISPVEAELMDPQQRLFLQEAYKAFEDAGYSRQTLNNYRCGVYLGIMSNDYDSLVQQSQAEVVNITGNSFAIGAARISYYLNLKGPAISIDTACSSSLIATHLACRALLDREIDMALSGGVTLYLTPESYIGMCAANMLAPDGLCKTFDNSANGFVPGEGAAAVVLKRVSDAQRDHDHIYGVIIGSGINQDGKTNGITAPSVNSQMELERDIYDKYKIDVESIGYVEMHGTGTTLGDPIELEALSTVFTERTDKKNYCAIGSVKSNIGHTSAAAGIASLQKVLLCLQHNKLVPTLHFSTPNTHFDFEDSPFYVNTELQTWERVSGIPRRAAVSSFGFSGTNAHLIVEEYLPDAVAVKTPVIINKDNRFLFVLSARTHEQLTIYVEAIKSYIQSHKEINLRDMAYTLQVGRQAMDCRFALMVASIKELKEKLQQFTDGCNDIDNMYHGHVKSPKETLNVFAGDEDMVKIIDVWVSKGKHAKLLELWVKGLIFDWNKLYGNSKPCRISLPTYPFVRERYWTSGSMTRCPDRSTTISSMPAASPQSAISADTLHTETAAGATSYEVSDKPGGILLPSLSEEQGLSDQSSAQLRQQITLKTVESEEPIQQSLISAQALQQELTTSLAETLYMQPDEIDPAKQFIDLGLDSILGVEWMRALNQQYGTSIIATTLYDHPNIREFAEFLSQELHPQGKHTVQSPRRTKDRPVFTPSAERENKATEHPLPFVQEADARIAIIGMSGRYPGAQNLHQYWGNLTQGTHSIREIPPSRWDVKPYYDPRPGQTGKIYCKWLGALDDIECFDPLFFNISPVEAELMDPQQRLFLQEAYTAFEDSGYSPQSLSHHKCGVYLGIMSNEYALLLSQSQRGAGPITGNSFAIAAARIAYYLNLKGPAIPIDTACSSSLVATHLACQALLTREIDLALVGGVTLYLSPESYIGMCAAGMLASDGHCKTFDNSADGFVPGEGVGAVVLKRFSDAVHDHDSIYGVIIGSAINQDGKTNGITAPSIHSQMDLARGIYEKYTIHPESIGYVEMHGTGTKLGDPIELEALSTVFREKTEHTQWCAIGSVKTNIGHTSAAAGVASVQKVLLCLQHKELVPTLHFSTPNEHFDFEESAFYVNTKLQAWETISKSPRRAAVSAFGMSGTNAHLVIEEYLPETNAVRTPVLINTDNRSLFVLSAGTEEQLKSYAANMKSYLEANEDVNLNDMAYTLQTGREAMEYRLTFLADSRTAFIKKLASYLDNSSLAGVLTSRVKKNQEGMRPFEADEDAQVLLRTWIRKRKFQKIAELWLKDLNLDWNLLYGNRRPHRISLPTYPFAKGSYWIPEAPNLQSSIFNIQFQRLHPLLHQNISDLSEQRFTSSFTGREFFLKDHLVNGQAVLPAVAYLEMARAAVEQSAGFLQEGQTQSTISLKNIVWARSLIVAEQPVTVHIGLFPEENGEIAFEVYSEPSPHPSVIPKSQFPSPPLRTGSIPKSQFDPIIHCQGRAGLHAVTEAPIVDLHALQAECSQTILSAEQIYATFRSMGIDYGEGQRGIETLYAGSGKVLAKLSLPSVLAETQAQFILHPSLLDSALQASIGLMASTVLDSELKPLLSFAMQELELFGECVAEMYALIRPSAGSKAEDKVQKLDIDLCDAQGRVCVRMQGFSARVLESEVDSAAVGTLLLEPDWQAEAAVAPALSPGEKDQAAAPIADDALREKAVTYFKKLLSADIKLPAHRIDADAPMEQYGIDSVLVMDLTNQLEKSFGSLPKTLFFEYQTIRELTAYFMTSYHAPLLKLLGLAEHPEASVEASKDPATMTAAVHPDAPRRRRFSAFRRAAREAHATGALDIAIIGLAGRYPQAGNLQEFWDNLRAGKDCITEIPPERWDHSLYFDAAKHRPGKTYSKWGGFLDGVDQFDALFFNISPREAEVMDPQERLFLECVYATLEDAGYTRQTLGLGRGAASADRAPGGNVGVFVGVMYEEYQLYGVRETLRGSSTALPGNPASIANRVSYFCNFHGPSMAVDTMCSSSLTAIHLGCHSIRRGECDLALAGGVNVSIHPNKYLLLGQGNFVSSKGRCESFGRGGDGYVPGEGVGAVLLKPLSRALADRDHIYGVIKATALNHGGKTNGYTVPNPTAQTAVIGRALQTAGLDPRTMSYVEAHGTGTSLGDPIEIAGLTNAFREYTQDTQFCALGSVKSNIGHCESAAGIAGVTKVLLQLQHRQLVPSLHSEVLNPNIDFTPTPFVVQQELAEWKRPVVTLDAVTCEYPRIAGISSFGAGGANAHLVIEEYIPLDTRNSQLATRNVTIIVLSAKNEDRLMEQTRRLFMAIEQEQFSEDDLADMAYTLQVGREAMEERLAVIVHSIQELEQKLTGFLNGEEGIEELYRGQVKRNKEALAVFAADEDMANIITTWIAKKKYAKLLDLWVKGLSIDWNTIYNDTKPHRISLPTYPFAKQRYWIPEVENPFELAQVSGTILLQTDWCAQAVTNNTDLPDYAQHVVILCERDDTYRNSIERHLDGVRVVTLHSEQTGSAGTGIDERFQTAAVQTFEEIQRILKTRIDYKKNGKVLLQLVVPMEGEQQLFAGLAGLLKTAQLEHPKLIGQLIGIESGEAAAELVEKLRKNARAPFDTDIRYQNGIRQVLTWSELTPRPPLLKREGAQNLPSPSRGGVGGEVLPWKDGGVYLISGGAGGLGLIFVREIAQQVKNATLILTGRSPLNQKKQSIIEDVQTSSLRVEYRQVDVTQWEAVSALIQNIQEEFGSLNGIIHSAGVIHDNFIRNKNRAELQTVLAPKVIGVVNLDQASQDLPLDFLILFSSLASILGNPGQADYATANAFLDAYAAYRNSLAASGERQGHTLSLNWPLWAEGGMQIDDASVTLMKQQTGMLPMKTATGIQAFYHAIETAGRSSLHQVMVMEGDLSRMRQKLRSMAAPDALTPPASPGVTDVTGRLENLQTELIRAVSQLLKVKIADIDADVELSEYGFDSISISEFSARLNDAYDLELKPTIFFEHHTIYSLAEYLIATYPTRFAARSANHNSSEAAVRGGEEDHEAGSSRTQSPESFFAIHSSKGRRFAASRGSQEREGELEPVAIIGMSGRFPMAADLHEFWDNLLQGKNCITEIPPERWDWREYYEPEPNKAAALHKSYSKWGGFLADFDRFDPQFFQMSPREAGNIDPQERVFLEACWHALEDAGCAPSSFSPELRRRAGVFAGITKQEFMLYQVEATAQFPCTSFAALANRVSYVLNFQGPSIPIDTMCSSALTAIHEACESLHHGRCDIALAGGVNVYGHPSAYIALSAARLISHTAHCAAFGKGGAGFVPGEGVGVLVLKPYRLALRDGDHIYAVIRGTAVNHSGKTASFTSPDPSRQAAVIQQALADARIDPRSISYIEAAASGSEMGDAIETAALTKVFDSRDGTQGAYAIGSVKPNIGHCEAASGMAQIMKVILALNHQTLPPTLLPDELNPTIEFERLPFQVQRVAAQWEPVRVDGVAVPRRAGITAIGAGGVNAHIIVEEYSPNTRAIVHPPQKTEEHLFVLSAQNQERLAAYVQRWIAYLTQTPECDVAGIAYTMQTGREALSCRLAVVHRGQEDLRHQLEDWLEQQDQTNACFWGQVKGAKHGSDEAVKQALDALDLRALGRFWIAGSAIPWSDVYHRKPCAKVCGLPVYPFTRRQCRPVLKQQAAVCVEPAAVPTAPVEPGYAATVAEFYSFWAQASPKNFQAEYLTFCPFTEKIPGFSMSRVFLHPEQYPEEWKLIRAKQIEMRQVLFCREDFQKIRTVFDIGCGYGTDVIQIAALYPHIQTHGFTITQAQADLGNQRIAAMQLNSRSKIFHKDSSKDTFPGSYDLIIGLEVSFHIRNKTGLFTNIISALNDGGSVLFMDYIANLRGAIEDVRVAISIPTEQEWIELLAKHHLVLDEIIDVSPQIANFLADPDVEQHTKDMPEVVRDTFRNYANQAVSLQKGWISYCLLKLKKAAHLSEQELQEYNAAKISQKRPYPEAVEEMLQHGRIPYPQIENTASAPLSDQRRDLDSQADAIAIKTSLTEIFASVLGFQREELDFSTGFKELGIGSVNAVELLEAINTRFDLSLPTSIIFECPDLDALSWYLARHLQRSEASAESPAPAPSPKTGGEVMLSGSLQEKRNDYGSDAIAIVGLACRTAGAKNQTEFWELVSQGRDAIQEITDPDWRDFLKRHTSRNVPARYGAMADIDRFDPLFFHISSKEAEAMDVAQRILLEVCYSALEDAGYKVSVLKDKAVGTIIGTMGNAPMGRDFSHFSMLGTDTSILAARIAYFLDLKGPALAINTACSSSLVAIDMACKRLQRREIDLAIAGGVTVYTHPGAFLAMHNTGMLSPRAECCPFDQAADGIVVGDGAGVVILKRLQDAEQDQDPIYGVIRGSGTNQDGRTSGITVPSFLSQSRLEASIYRAYRVPVEEIQYIEAHGTGTKLGDPIEIHALSHAFQQFTPKTRFCALGSVKANIGHTAAAAGVLGVIKVLLSLKYQQIPSSINFTQENEHIDFAQSPVYVNTVLQDWPLNAAGKRLAAVSSFGFSGTNAHLVLEDYPGPPGAPAGSDEGKVGPVITQSRPGVLLLSAAREEGLAMYAGIMKAFLQAHPDMPLADILYTFQVAREELDYRVAIVANDSEEFLSRLEQFASRPRPDHSAGIYTGQIQRQTGMQIGETAEGLEFIRQLIRHRKVNKLAELWVNGSRIDWEASYPEGTVRRLSGLPTYPFAGERYWIPESEQITSNIQHPTLSIQSHRLHPLLHQNISDLSEQRFTSSFTGREFFLKDHLVNGQAVLPAVAYLEMARAAVEQSAGFLQEGQTQSTISLKNIVWARPLIVAEQPVTVHIGLFPEENGEIAFEVYSEPSPHPSVIPKSQFPSPPLRTGSIPKSQFDPIIHCQGRAGLHAVTEAPIVDLHALQAECSQTILSAEQIYATFRSMGIDYGEGQRGIETLYAGSGKVLAKLSLPSVLAETQAQFVLHPSLLDSALQASIGLMASTVLDSELKPLLPFAMQELELFGECVAEMYALIRPSAGSKAEDKVQKLDIDLCDAQGRVCVRMQGFSARVLESEVDSAAVGTLLLEPDWQAEAVVPNGVPLEYAQHLVILCEPPEMLGQSIEQRLNGVRVLSLQKQEQGIAKRFKAYSIQVFEELQTLLKEKSAGNALVQVVFHCHLEEQLFSGLSGLLKTARLENPKVCGQAIGLEAWPDKEKLIEILQVDSRCPHNTDIRYQAGKRYVAGWKEIELSDKGKAFKQELRAFESSWRKNERPWKDGGVYLITGGAGGLGLIFAKEIVAQVQDATLILSGRSALDNDKQAQIESLQHNGCCVEYRQADVSDRQAVEDLIKNILQKFGSLNGIIHSAGVIHDNFIIKKSTQEFQQVLAPKVTGVVNLDEAGKQLKLDFFVCFSSIAAAMGNLGQADYAAANAFMDTYVEYRNALVASGQRQGHTLSINWPLWQAGGMQIDKAIEKLLRQRTGLIPIQTSTGIRALYHSLVSGHNQVMVLEGDLKWLYAAFLEMNPGTLTSKTASPGEKDQAAAPIADDALREKAVTYFKKLLSADIKLPAHRIDADAPMEQYGIDSVLVMDLTNQLEKSFGSLPKTLFFEYQTIRELTAYFMTSYHAPLLKLLELAEHPEASVEASKDPATMTAAVHPDAPRRRRFSAFRRAAREAHATGALDIAIIGLAGRYPQAGNLQEFWDNLRAGKDCITEIPPERWDHSLYFDAAKHRPGKTYSKWGGFLDGVDQFDALFFNISPREAEVMDPQERLFLECVYATLEDAGYTRQTLGLGRGAASADRAPGGNVGVFVGVMYEEYQLYGVRETLRGSSTALPGNPASIANRVSYFCNFHGPSMAVDTMCSSSLTAIHLGCHSIRRGECDLALAGGVNVSIHPNKYLLLGQGNFVSSKGRCESFGRGGDGYVPGEGVGAVLLKPLSRALADRDHIYGVIKATALNHGGKTNGYTVPNPTAQTAVIGRALQTAGLDPRTMSYVEAHGTGTSLGDPIEIAGLTNAFREYTQDTQFCALGSVKSNIGHCESAAGIAGVTKVLLQLQHRQLVPSLHSEVLNPNIDFTPTPFVVQQELAEWKRPVVTLDAVTCEYPRIAGISSFGAGGANAHLVIEEYRSPHSPPPTPQTHPPAIILISAKNEDELQAQVQQLLAAIRERQFSDSDLPDMAYTLQVGREAMEERLAVIVHSIQELEQKLTGFLNGEEGIEELYRGQVKRNKEALAVFAADEELQEAIDKWIQRRKYGKLLDVWVKGVMIDWNLFYGNVKPGRISLPTYPFARERYWIPEGKTGSDDSRAAADSTIAAPTQLSIARHNLFPVTPPKSSYSEISDKPKRIVLPALSDTQIPSEKTVPDSQQFTREPASTLLPEISGGSETVTPVKTANSEKSLQEELTASLANALYLDRQMVTPDKHFVEMGLDSIIGLEWIREINSTYGTSIEASTVYDYPTIGKFARFLKQELKRSQPLLYHLSEGQKGIWMLHKMMPNMSAYNLPFCIRFQKRVDVEKFQQACRFLLQEYPILTTVIAEEHGVPYQMVQPGQPLDFCHEDISPLRSDEILPYLRAKKNEPFELERGPLMRVHLFSRSASPAHTVDLSDLTPHPLQGRGGKTPLSLQERGRGRG